MKRDFGSGSQLMIETQIVFQTPFFLGSEPLENRIPIYIPSEEWMMEVGKTASSFFDRFTLMNYDQLDEIKKEAVVVV